MKLLTNTETIMNLGALKRRINVMEKGSESALSGLRVLDMSRILAGPWAAQMLADLGAEVIKIERPETGDDTRGWGPPFLKDGDGAETTEAAYYLCANRNKKSVTLDISTPEGQNIVKELVKKSDVLIENYKVGGLAQYGLDYDSLSSINPRLIYCSVTGFGQTGPYSPRAGYDFLIQAMGGLMSITGGESNQSGAGPQKVGVAVTDVLTGVHGVVGILAALIHRSNTGVGQHVDMALLDVQVSALANQSLNYLTTGVSPKRLGNAHPNIVPYQDFPTKDGDMIIAVGNDGQFARLCEVLGCGQLAREDRFADNRSRVAHRETLIELLKEKTVTRPTLDWVAALEAVGVPCGPINNIEGVFDDPQVKSRQLRIDLPHPLAGKVPLVANPIRLSATPVRYRNAPPTLGQDTREVLSALVGLSTNDIDDLFVAGVL